MHCKTALQNISKSLRVSEANDVPIISRPEDGEMSTLQKKCSYWQLYMGRLDDILTALKSQKTIRINFYVHFMTS